jgi:hypothetical protein
MEAEGSLPHLEQPAIRFREVCEWLLRWGVVGTSLNSQVGAPLLVGCPRLLIQNIRSYPPYLQAVRPSATWGRAMLWWQGPIYRGVVSLPAQTLQIYRVNIIVNNSELNIVLELYLPVTLCFVKCYNNPKVS